MNLESLDLNPMPPASAPLRSFPHESYAAAARTVMEATKLGPGFVLLTGAAGTGKTTLIHDLAEQLERDGYCVGRVANSRVDADDLLRLASFAFGLKAHSSPKARLLSGLADRLRSMCPAGKPAILIIDEAQDLAPGALPELCQLVGLPGAKVPPVQILLSGRDRVWELLDRPDHAQIRQRILASCRLHPLSLEDTRAFIAHSLDITGWRGDPGISADALRLVHARTGGVPRLISLTLGHLLLHGRQLAARVLESQDVETVLAHLGKDHPELLPAPPGLTPRANGVPARPLSTRDLRLLPTSGESKPRSEPPPSSRPRDFPGENAPPTPGGSPEGSAGRYWKLGLTGLAAAALIAYLLGFHEAGEQLDLPEPPRAPEIALEMAPEVGSEELSPVADAGSMEPPLAEGVQTPLSPPSADPPGVPALMATDPGIPAPPGDAAGSGESQLASVESGPTITGPEDASGPPDDSLSETSAVRPEIPRGTDEAAPLVAAETASPDHQAPQSPEVVLLLEKAELALSKNHLMAPASDNAYGYYREVLALDPANEKAQAGVQRIITRYRELAQQSLKKGDRADARRYASRGLTLAPGDRQLLAIQRQAQASRPRARKAQREAPEAAAVQPENPELLDRIEAWLRSGRTDTSHFLDH